MALITEVSKLDYIFWIVDVDLDSVELMLQKLPLFFYDILNFSESKIESIAIHQVRKRLKC